MNFLEKLWFCSTTARAENPKSGTYTKDWAPQHRSGLLILTRTKNYDMEPPPSSQHPQDPFNKLVVPEESQLLWPEDHEGVSLAALPPGCPPHPVYVLLRLVGRVVLDDPVHVRDVQPWTLTIIRYINKVTAIKQVFLNKWKHARHCSLNKNFCNYSGPRPTKRVVAKRTVVWISKGIRVSFPTSSAGLRIRTWSDLWFFSFPYNPKINIKKYW